MDCFVQRSEFAGDYQANWLCYHCVQFALSHCALTHATANSSESHPGLSLQVGLLLVNSVRWLHGNIVDKVPWIKHLQSEHA